MTATAMERIEGELQSIRRMLEGTLLPQAVTFEEASRRLSCSPKHVGRMVKQGVIHPVMVGSLRRIPVSEIERLVRPPRASMPERTALPKAAQRAVRGATRDADSRSRRLALLKRR